MKPLMSMRLGWRAKYIKSTRSAREPSLRPLHGTVRAFFPDRRGLLALPERSAPRPPLAPVASVAIASIPALGPSDAMAEAC